MGALWQSDSTKAAVSESSVDQPSLPKTPAPRRLWRRVFWLVLLMALIALGFATAREVRTSALQARELSRLAASLTYTLEPGPSEAIVYPGAGPFDKRLGYSALGEFCPGCLNAIIGCRRKPGSLAR